MSDTRWMEAVQRWRELPPEERRRRHLEAIPSPRRQLDGDGGRARERDVDPETTCPSRSATRYIETSAGILSYQQLAPLLAGRAAEPSWPLPIGGFEICLSAISCSSSTAASAWLHTGQ